MQSFQITPRLLACLMLETLKGMIVLADKFEDVPSGPQLVAQLCRPGFGITFGIVKSEVDLQRLIVHSMNALDDVHLIAFRVTQTIQPNLSVQANRIDDERVAFPVADGVAVVCGSQVSRMFAPV